jgi:hypothetical protein
MTLSIVLARADALTDGVAIQQGICRLSIPFIRIAAVLTDRAVFAIPS